MKIVIDGRFYGLEHAGLGRYTMALIEELSKIDKSNTYYLLLTDKYSRELKLPTNWKKIIVPFRHYSIREQTELPKILKKIDYDLIHFLHFNVPLMLKSNFVVTIHDLLMHKSKGKEATTLPPILYKLKRLGYHLVFKNAVVNSKRIIVPTKFVKNELTRYYKISDSKVVVAYEGVEKKATKTANGVLRRYSVNNPYFIYTGNAYPHKNLARAIEAIVFLNGTLENPVQLLVVSSRGVFTKRLEKTIELLGAEKYVRLLGFVPDDDLKSLYMRSLGFIYPSLSEGFGLPGLEAMSSGTLAIVSDIPVFREVYKDKALYFNPYDFSTIEKKMKEVIDLPDKKRQEMIKEGKAFVENYSWMSMAKTILEVYEEVGKKR